MYNGLVVVNKEKGYTSFDVVAKLRGVFGQKKIGHTGTLDPDAQGVLVICLGSATKVCGMLTDTDKEYEAVLLLGKETDTQDCSGTVLRELPVTASDQEVRDEISRFQGELMQVPPMYSALKVDGKKLCDLARAGKSVERRPRKITVYESEILGMNLPRVRIRIRCSKGTYIRTLCHEIGRSLGCGGCMESLVRTGTGGFSIRDAVTVGQLQEAKEQGRLGEFVRSVDSLFPDYPKVMVKEQAGRLLFNGNPLAAEDVVPLPGEGPGEDVPALRQEDGVPEDADHSRVRVYDAAGRFCAVYRYQQESRRLKPVKMFLPL